MIPMWFVIERLARTYNCPPWQIEAEMTGEWYYRLSKLGKAESAANKTITAINKAKIRPR